MGGRPDRPPVLNVRGICLAGQQRGASVPRAAPCGHSPRRGASAWSSPRTRLRSSARLGSGNRGGVAKGDPGKAGNTRQENWKTFEKENLDDLMDEGENRTDFLLRFTLSHPNMHTTIVGTLNPDHLAKNVAAATKGPLPNNTYEQAKQRLKTAGQQPVAD